jgi:hypothetical protein
MRVAGRAGAVLLLAACAGAQAGMEGGVYRDGAVAFRIAPVPQTWRPIRVGEAALAYRDEPHDASVLVNGRCGERDGDAPLVALTNQLVMGTTDRTVTLEETIPFDSREAHHTRMTAKLDGVPVAFDIWVMKKDGCVYDLVYVAPPDRLEAGVADFERFVRGFHAMGGVMGGA